MNRVVSWFYGNEKDEHPEFSGYSSESTDSSLSSLSSSSGGEEQFSISQWTVKRTLSAHGTSQFDRVHIVGMPDTSIYDRYVCSEASSMFDIVTSMTNPVGAPLHALHAPEQAIYAKCTDIYVLHSIANACTQTHRARGPDLANEVRVHMAAEDPVRRRGITKNRFAQAHPDQQVKILERNGTLQRMAATSHTEDHFRRGVTRSHDVNALRKPRTRHGFLNGSSSSSSDSSDSNESDSESDSIGTSDIESRRAAKGKKTRKGERFHAKIPITLAPSHIRLIANYSTANECSSEEAEEWFTNEFQKANWYYINAALAETIHYFTLKLHARSDASRAEETAASIDDAND